MKRSANDEQERPKKRAKLPSTSSSQTTQKFANADAIRTTLRAQNLDVLAQGTNACLYFPVSDVDSIITQG